MAVSKPSAIALRLQQWLVTPNPSRRLRSVCLGLSFVAPLVYGLLALHQGWGEWVVQDDARQYLFWMARFTDPNAFPNDPIANYFQSVTPLGYTGLYRMGAAVGLAPFTFNKLLPIVLALVTTGYVFEIALTLLPVPFTGFVATLLLNQTLWMKDDLISATPRAFVYPFFAAFLYYWVQYRARPKASLIWPTSGIAVSLLLLGLFYPQYVLVASAVLGLQLVTFSPFALQLTRRNLVFCGVGLAIAATVMGYYALTASGYGPTITAAQARELPEFWPGGRNFFFSNNLWWFYLLGDRSGLLHVGLVRPATLLLGLGLPLALRRRGPLASYGDDWTTHRGVLWRIWVAGFIWFVAAHLMLFRLHLPSRYLDHTWRFVMAIAAGIVVTAIVRWLLRRRLGLLGLGLGAALLLAYPAFVENFPLTKYKVAQAPQLHRLLRDLPPDSRIASIAEPASNIPAFAARSVAVAREYAIPYHLGYYLPFRQRAIALAQAQYTPNLTELQAVIRQQGIDFWMLERSAYEPDYPAQSWIAQYRADIPALTAFESGEPSALAAVAPRCQTATVRSLQLINTDCILNQSE
ncbi:MAG: hypothetical protein AAF289_12775 [Cyanobacteria bacterium P01_A01_bin.135]